jgi:hypothetical protein
MHLLTSYRDDASQQTATAEIESKKCCDSVTGHCRDAQIGSGHVHIAGA